MAPTRGNLTFVNRAVASRRRADSKRCRVVQPAPTWHHLMALLQANALCATGGENAVFGRQNRRRTVWLPMAKAIASGRFGVSVIALVLLAGPAEPPSAAPSGGDEPVLGSMVGSHLGSPQHDPDIDGKVAPPPIGNPLWAISLQSLTSTRARPLFSPSRRPAAVAIAAPAAAAPPTQAKPAEPVRPPLTLVGTAVGTDLTMGIFDDEATKDVVRLRV